MKHFKLAKNLFILFAFCSLFFHANKLQAQTGNQTKGVVSFVTSQNVYLKFENTNQINPEDTIFIMVDGKPSPCLKIIQKSSISCLAEIIGDCPVSKDLEVFHKAKPKSESNKIQALKPIEKEKEELIETEDSTSTKNKLLNNLNGRVSLANYNTTNGTNSNNRTVGRVYLNAKEILGSKFNFKTYLNFNRVNKNINSANTQNTQFNLFQFDLTYRDDKGFSAGIGRNINNRFLSVGAVDGLHAEKVFEKFFTGAIIGFKPNPFNYNFSSNLFQAGAYAGIFHDKNKLSNTTIGFVEQRNSNLTDRRYLFLQHQSNLTAKLNLFASAEADLFSVNLTGVSSSNLNLTSLFTSLSYRATKKLNLVATLDFRRNLILYQSYSDNLPILINNNPLKTGLRLRANYQISKNIYTGFGYNQRIQSDNNNDFYNISGFLSFSRLLGGRLNLNFNQNQNEFFNYRTYSARYTYLFIHKKLDVSPYFRFNQFGYTKVEGKAINQIYTGLDLHYSITKKLSIGTLFEFSKREQSVYNRFNINIIQRF